MTIPFLQYFKRKPKEPAFVAPPPTVAAVEKPDGERLSKTVLPNAVWTSQAGDPFHTGGSNGTKGSGRKSVSFGGSDYGSERGDLPPAVALAIEPNVERVISLELADVLPQMPAGFVRPMENGDAERRVLLKAAELERGMAKGQPTVSIASIYQQAPEIFLRPVENSDSTQVALPFTKVMEQFSNVQMREDQFREQDVPQVETPFLQVTLEDNSRFGVATGPVRTAVLPPVRLEPPTAANFAAAEPEPALRDKPAINLPKPLPVSPVAKQNGASPIPPVAQPAAIPAPVPAPPPASKAGPVSAPARIPFSLKPNGTDASASESVPVSSGPSVPTSTPPPASAPPVSNAPVSVPPAAGPKRIPFKMSAPSDDARPKDEEPWLTKETFEDNDPTPVELPPPPKAAEPKAEVKISLPLKPILETLPPFQLTGDIGSVPEDARLEVPFSLVEQQLASGRVSLKPEDFAAGMPETYRGLFSAKDIDAAVMMPLQNVLKNLPSASLRMRDDQEEAEKGADFATPFSARAEEDAKRFKVSGAPVPKPVGDLNMATPVAPAPEAKADFKLKPASPSKASSKTEVTLPEPTAAPVAEPAAPIEAKAIEEPAKEETKPARTALQEIFETDDELDAKAVVARISKMPKVDACAVMFADGLTLAGELPPKYGAEGLCAMAPSLLQRIENHMIETKLGALGAMTLSCAESDVTFFMHKNLCLAAFHARNALASEVQERLKTILHELSRTYSHPV